MFFLKRAKKINPKVDKAFFCYPGPKPLSPETAIVMLADAIEAKLRLCKDITKKDIEDTVDEIISERLSQKQLDLSGVKDSSLKDIRSSFIDTLLSIHHQRISYKS